MNNRFEHRVRAARFALGLLCALGVAGGCSDSQDGASTAGPVHGPPGGILDVDTSSIGSAGQAGHGAGGKSSQAGSGGGTNGGSTSTGGATNGGATGGASSQAGAGAGGASGGASSVGKLCESNADCPSPLYCRQDPVDYTGHKQCTIDCETSAECEAAFGKDSFCIGARICVDRCQQASDCPAKTQCNSSHWCIRSGPGSGVPRCDGPIFICGGLDATGCLLTAGCIYNSDCNGSSQSCYAFFSAATCASQDGCYWSSSEQHCNGVATSCSGEHSSGSCNGQDGCYWYESCTGSARQCWDLLPAICSTQAGCSLTFD